MRPAFAWLGLVGVVCLQPATGIAAYAGELTVGSTAYPSDVARAVGSTWLPTVGTPKAMLYDNVQGYIYELYYADNLVVKLRVQPKGAPPVVVSSTRLGGETSEFTAQFGVIDPVRGFLYIITSYKTIIKMSLGDGDAAPVRIGSAPISLTGDLSCCAADLRRGYIYLADGTKYSAKGSLIKVAMGAGGDLPYEVSRLTFATQCGAFALVVDEGGGFVYASTNDAASSDDRPQFIKFSVGDGDEATTHVSTLVVTDYGAHSPGTGFISPDGRYIWWSAYRQVLKQRLGGGASPGELVGYTDLPPFSSYPFKMLPDFANGVGYIFSGGYGISKISLGEDDGLPSHMASTQLPLAQYRTLLDVVMDAGAGRAYVTTNGTDPRVEVVHLSAGGEVPAYLGSVNFPAGETQPTVCLGDSKTDYLYVCTSSKLSKYRAGEGLELPVRVGEVTLPAGVGRVSCGVIDREKGYIYLGTDASPASVLKFSIGPGDLPPVYIGRLPLWSGENELTCAVIDEQDGFAYFGTGNYNFSSYIVKVGLGSGDSLPYHAANLTPGKFPFTAATIDARAGYAYFAMDNSYYTFFKVKLRGEGTPKVVSSVSGSRSPDYAPEAGVIDETGAFSIWAGTTSSNLYKVTSGVGDGPMSVVTTKHTLGFHAKAVAGAWDRVNHRAYFGNSEDDGGVYVYDPGAGVAAASRVGALGFPVGERYVRGAVIDGERGFAYFVTNQNSAPTLVKVGLSQKDWIKGTSFSLAEKVRVRSLELYSHESTGTVRLAVYANDTSRTLLWESGVTTNTVAGGWLSVRVEAGSSQTLTLEPGDYWLAWQTDSVRPVVSFVPGDLGDGFAVKREAGKFPSSLRPPDGAESDGTPGLAKNVVGWPVLNTAERWTSRIEYDLFKDNTGVLDWVNY